jgi:hypothetical protein
MELTLVVVLTSFFTFLHDLDLRIITMNIKMATDVADASTEISN